jgi:hypothetical protein
MTTQHSRKTEKHYPASDSTTIITHKKSFEDFRLLASIKLAKQQTFEVFL